MRALILAAGVGQRLAGGGDHPPKAMLRFGGTTLLQRHLEILGRCGVQDVVIGVGYHADAIRAEIARLGMSHRVSTIYNADYVEGSIVTLWTLRQALANGQDIVLMDADVLYDHRLLQRLLETRHANCFLLDRNLEPGEEPVKLCVKNGRLVEFRKRIDPGLEYDYQGESVGFFRFSSIMAERVAARAQRYIDGDQRREHYEEALRDELLADEGRSFGFEDVTGLPWIEIDFAEDIRRAEEEVLPLLRN